MTTNELYSYCNSYRECLKEAVDNGFVDHYQLTFPCDINVFTVAYLELIKFTLRRKEPTSGELKPQQKVPPGNWYFYTITQPANKTEQDIRELHDKSLAFFSRRNIHPYLISLEKSGIYHTHGLIRCEEYAKNLARDLSRECNNYRVHLSHKITTPKEFNRIVNYIRKKGYEDDETHLEIILEKKIYE